MPGTKLGSLHSVYITGYGVGRCGEAVTPASHFRIASISKVFTALTVLKLCHEKRVTLDTEVFGKLLFKRTNLSNFMYRV